MHPIRTQEHDVILLEGADIPIDNMSGSGIHQDMNLVKIMKMLKLHIDIVRTLVIIKIIKKGIYGRVDTYAIPLFVQ